MGAVAVVTDSTACLSAELLAGGGIRVVPLRVVLADRVADEGVPGQDPAAESVCMPSIRRKWDEPWPSGSATA